MMGAVPAESSKPVPRFGGGAGLQDPVFEGIAVIVFAAALIGLASAVRGLSEERTGGGGSAAPGEWLLAIVCVILVFLILWSHARHPNVQSSATTAAMKVMSAVMFLAGVVLFIGGVSGIIVINGWWSEAALAILSMAYVVTPLAITLGRKR